MNSAPYGFCKHHIDDSFLKKIKSVINPLLTPYEEALSTAYAEIKQLKSQMSEKGTTIRALTKDIQDLQIKCDDIEQQGRKGSIRVFGVAESTPGTTGNKVLSILNDNVKVTPKLTLDDLEVTHRVGRPPPGSAAQNEGTGENAVEAPAHREKQTRNILIKFANRRTETLVMEAKNWNQAPTESELAWIQNIHSRWPHLEASESGLPSQTG